MPLPLLPPGGVLERRISAIVDERSEIEPVIALHGPRSVGKSTVLLAFARARGTRVIDLDDPLVRDAAAANVGSVIDQQAPLCIDEYQHVPDFLDAIKARLNREGSRPGTAVLTGSTRQDALPRTAQALTGRLHTMTIWPLSQGEIGSTVENILEALAVEPDHAVHAHPSSSTTRAEYIARACTGGFPLAVSRSDAARNRWFDDYIAASVERDALELVRIRQRQTLRDLLSRLAGLTSQVLNLSTAIDGLDLDRKTAEGYTKLLEDLYLITRIPAWGTTLRVRSVRKPKLHVVDSGLAARLLRLTPERLSRLDPTALTEFGRLLETFVVGELRKQASWLAAPPALGHWRTHDGDEVDIVVEFDDGGVVAFEVKAAERIQGKDFTSLRKLRDALGDRFIAGVALSTGRRSYTCEQKLHVMPIDRLWTTVV